MNDVLTPPDGRETSGSWYPSANEGAAMTPSSQWEKSCHSCKPMRAATPATAGQRQPLRKLRESHSHVYQPMRAATIALAAHEKTATTIAKQWEKSCQSHYHHAVASRFQSSYHGCQPTREQPQQPLQANERAATTATNQREGSYHTAPGAQLARPFTCESPPGHPASASAAL